MTTDPWTTAMRQQETHTPLPPGPVRWADLGPRFAALLEEPLAPERVPAWLAAWSDLQKIVWEARAGLKRDRSRDRSDEAASAAFEQFVGEVMAPFGVANDGLARKLLAVPDWEPAPEHRQLRRRLRASAGLLTEENAATQGEVDALAGEHGAISATMSVSVAGRELSGPELEGRVRDADRSVREQAWRAQAAAWAGQRGRIDELFLEILPKRRRLAANAGLPSYRAYRWRELGLLDYTPADCMRLHEAIASEVVPLAARRMERRRAALGMKTLRPWDLEILSDDAEPRLLFPGVGAWEEAMAGVFAGADGELGALFGRMRRGYLDLGWRRGKQGGGEEWAFPVSRTPYVLVGADGTEEGVALLLHEMGHAYHDHLAMAHQRLIWNQSYPDEMAALAAMAMMHLARPYLERGRGGFLSPDQVARLRVRALEEVVVKWLPYISLVDRFHHWVYADAPDGVSPRDLDEQWLELYRRYTPWVDVRGIEEEVSAGWLREWSVFGGPFYFISYGLAHLGALQLARNAERDPAGAWRSYRRALALGGTRPLPELYAAAGARLPFDRAVVADVAGYVGRVLAADSG